MHHHLHKRANQNSLHAPTQKCERSGMRLPGKDSARPQTFILSSPGLERTLPAHIELELPGAAVELVMADRNAVVEPQRADGEVEAYAQTPVVTESAQVEVVGFASHTADVVEQREAHANTMLLLEDRDAVLRRGKPIRVAAHRLIKSGRRGGTIVLLARADVIVLEAAQRVRAAQIITLKERHVGRIAECRHHSCAPPQFQHVAREKPAEVTRALETQLVKGVVAAQGTARELGGQRGALALVGQLNAVAGIVSEGGPRARKQVLAYLAGDVRRNVARRWERGGGQSAGVVRNAHALQRVADAAPDKVAAQCALKPDLASGAGFVIDGVGAEEGIVVIV